VHEDGDHLVLDGDTWLCVLTGAGVSAESGIATFRDAGGLWEGHRAEEVASPEGFEADPALVWSFYGARRRQAGGCAPNKGHRALAEVERRLQGRFLLATQNVDGLHEAAGNRRVVELHGSLWRSRCAACDRPPFEDRADHEGLLPRCEECRSRGRDALLRPDIVWFGEALDPADLERVHAFLDEGAAHRLVFLAVGTSGVVYPAAGLVDEARARGAETWLVNVEAPENARRFRRFLRGRSGEILPRLFVYD
jgi:NAD-dependent deacetylase